MSAASPHVVSRAASADVARAGWLCLFNRPDFHALNRAPDDAVVLVDHVEDGRPVAALGGVLRDGRLHSGFSAPFGGFDFARPRERADLVESAVDGLLAQAGAAGAGTVEIRCRPAGWSDNEATVAFALLNRGFRVDVADLAYVIDLSPFAAGGADAYVEALKSPARRALRHALAAPLAFGPSTDWERSHALLHGNRASRGWTLSLTWAKVAALREAFPDRIQVFDLCSDGGPVASAIVMTPGPGRWFVPAWGDGGHDLDRSPMNLLAHRVVERALAAGITQVDLGTSTQPSPDGGLRSNPGLIQFKQSILARPHLRPVLIR